MKAKLPGVFEKEMFDLSMLSAISETSSVENCPSPGWFISNQVLRYCTPNPDLI